MTPLTGRSVEGSFTVTIQFHGIYRLYAPDLYPGGRHRYLTDLAECAADQFCDSIISGKVTARKVSVRQETNGYRASVVPDGEVA